MNPLKTIDDLFSNFDWVSQRQLPNPLRDAVLTGRYFTHQKAATLALVQSAEHEGRQPHQFCLTRFGDGTNRIIRLALHRFRRGTIYYDAQGTRVGDDWVVTNYFGHNNIPVYEGFYSWFPDRPETVGETRDVKPFGGFGWT